MIRRELAIVNKLGLHARAAAKFVTYASRYTSEVQLEYKNQQVNGKSILGVMMLAAAQGTTVTLITDGEDEAEAADALEDLVRNRFGETE
jgi:phosphocarrier protein HPr